MIANRSISGVPSVSGMLHKCRHPLVGLEYLIEIINVPNDKPNYHVCILCDSEIETHQQVKQHMVSVAHRVAFLVSNTFHDAAFVQPIRFDLNVLLCFCFLPIEISLPEKLATSPETVTNVRKCELSVALDVRPGGIVVPKR